MENGRREGGSVGWIPYENRVRGTRGARSTGRRLGRVSGSLNRFSEQKSPVPIHPLPLPLPPWLLAPIDPSIEIRRGCLPWRPTSTRRRPPPPPARAPPPPPVPPPPPASPTSASRSRSGTPSRSGPGISSSTTAPSAATTSWIYASSARQTRPAPPARNALSLGVSVIMLFTSIASAGGSRLAKCAH
uniref:Uncharacterized protein n=1 Tax=Leersia perrieri TaxID=77586 RepID=A0A0D9UVU9_9ORYZ